VGTRDPASVVDIRSIVIPGFGGKGRIVGVISETTRATPVTVGRLAPSPSWQRPRLRKFTFGRTPLTGSFGPGSFTGPRS